MSQDALPKSSLMVEIAIGDYVLHHRASRSSLRTIENHLLCLNRFKDWLRAREVVDIGSITPTIIREYIHAFSVEPSKNGKMAKPSTVWTHFKNIRAFMTYLNIEGEISSNPASRVKSPRLTNEILPAFTQDDLDRLELATSGRDLLSLRNRALVYFLLDTGCRLAEATNMLITDVNLNEGRVQVRCGKGGKDRIVWLGTRALKSLLRYLRTRTDRNPALWVGQYGPVTRAGMRMILEKLGKSCNVHCHAHKFRRTTALTMLRNGCDIYSIRSLLGHSDLQVLQRYLAQTDQDIRQAHERHGVVDNLTTKTR
jgi:site-specific recombinase XerD